MNKVDDYIDKHENFLDILQEIRKTVLGTNLKEEIKWGMPVYTYQGKNIVGMASFKEHCGVWFFKGALLKDQHNVLINAQEGKTTAMRQWKFNREDDVNSKLLLLYVEEAIKNEKKGLKIKPQKKPLVIPKELRRALQKDKRLNNNFDMFTLSKKREFAEYISNAKREETKTKRLEKIIPMILNNIGLNDKYRNC